jgi:hypothetical protein
MRQLQDERIRAEGICESMASTRNPRSRGSTRTAAARLVQKPGDAASPDPLESMADNCNAPSAPVPHSRRDTYANIRCSCNNALARKSVDPARPA